MYGFEICEVGPDVSRPAHAKTAYCCGAEVAEDVTEEVLHNENVKLRWILHERSRSRIGVKVARRNRGVLSRDLVEDFAEKREGAENVALVDTSDAFDAVRRRILPGKRRVKGKPADALDADTRHQHLVCRRMVIAHSEAACKIETFGVLSDDDIVNLARCMHRRRGNTRKQSDGAQVRISVEAVAEQTAEQSAFGPIRLSHRREADWTLHRCIRRHEAFERARQQRVAGLGIDLRPCSLLDHRQADAVDLEAASHDRQCGFDEFRADSVTWNHGDAQLCCRTHSQGPQMLVSIQKYHNGILQNTDYVRSRMDSRQADVIVVGGGNAAFCAAHAAAQRGRSVLVLEKAPRDAVGGNSFYTAGATRIAHAGLEDIRDVIDADERHAVTEVPPYSEADYTSDLERVTEGRNDPELTSILVSESQAAVRWLSGLGMRYRLMYERQAYDRLDGTYLFWGGLHVGNTGGGEGLIADHLKIAEELGETVIYDCEVNDLIQENGVIVGVLASAGDEQIEYRAESVILGAGGFEGNVEMREKHLGEGWRNAKLRGTPCNTGQMIEAGLRVGAARGGDWSTAHSVQWDALADNNESNRELTNRLTRQGYPFGIIVNRDGNRFVNEGEDFRNYTYAKFGREILKQPENIAYQIFDASTRLLCRSEEYEMPGISEVVAGNIEELAEKTGINTQGLVKTVTDFNENIDESHAFDPTVKDQRASNTLPPKSNWASAFVTAPFYAYPVTCGITFTFGGLRSDINGRVIDESDNHIPGLFVCGEMLGGLFSRNYPGGSGLAAGMVFGRRAGSVA